MIVHKFLNSDFFLPTWDIETLVLGTFNPSCGEETDYFYGRCQNNFWRTIEEINGTKYRWYQNNLERKMQVMKDNKFGCTDIIKSIELKDESYKNEICGKGYSDQNLFTKKKFTLVYNFDKIKSFIKKNNVLKIINTWGKRENPLNFKNYVGDLKIFCDQNNILFIEKCPSPSGRIRGKEHKIRLIEFYKTHIIKPAHNNV
ncbi:hypothetical protein OAS44_01840 [Flavobacteriaceae bacterium]|nr:hypothetical protein [Flavobacteriaceae bacterium]